MDELSHEVLRTLNPVRHIDWSSSLLETKTICNSEVSENVRINLLSRQIWILQVQKPLQKKPSQIGKYCSCGHIKYCKQKN